MKALIQNENPSSWQELLAVMKETTQGLRETRNLFAEADRRMAETDRRMAETDRQMKETDRRMKELQGLFQTQWGKLVEALAKPASLNLFKQKGIGITQVYNGPRKGVYDKNAMEVDVILCNTTVAVAVEVKTTCKVADVDYYLSQMEHFKEVFHPFKNYVVYPAITALKFDESSDKYALSKGMYVLPVVGEGSLALLEPDHLLEY